MIKIKVVKGGKAKREGSASDPIELRAKDLAERAAGGDLDALKAMEKIVVSFERWRKALANQAAEREACKSLVLGAEATLANRIEEAMPESATLVDWPIVKLRGIEVAWQDTTEARAERDERAKAANETVRKWAAALERAMRDGAQLTIPGTD